METRAKTFKKRKRCRDASTAHWYTKHRNKLQPACKDDAHWFTKHWNKVHVGVHPVIKVVGWNHTAIPGPTSVNQTAIPYISSSQLLTLQNTNSCSIELSWQCYAWHWTDFMRANNGSLFNDPDFNMCFVTWPQQKMNDTVSRSIIDDIINDTVW